MATKKASLAELMGSKAAGSGGLSLKQLPDVLGDAMPELPRNAVGRYRLIRALQQRFGDNFRALPGVSGLVKEFDEDIKFESRVNMLKAIKYERKK